MKALLSLAAGAFLVFLLIVLLVSGLMMARNGKAPTREPSNAEQDWTGGDRHPPPLSRHDPGRKHRSAAEDQPTVIVPGVVGGVEYPFPPGFTPNARDENRDCAGQTGHNLGPCAGHVSLTDSYQAP